MNRTTNLKDPAVYNLVKAFSLLRLTVDGMLLIPKSFAFRERFLCSLALIVRHPKYCKFQNEHSTSIEIHSHTFTRELHHIPEVSTINTYPVLQSKCLQHWFKNWHEQRRNKLTASIFGGAIGFWPNRRVQLWLEKLGAIEPFSGNLATIWSNIKEEEALEQYKLETGNRIVCFPEFQLYGKENHEDDWLAGSPDGVVDGDVYGLPSHGVLEIKCPFFDGDKQKAYPWSRIPLYCMPQAQGLMEIMDKDWMDFYVWTLHGSSLFRIYRNREYWKLLEVALSDFWLSHVLPAKEICSKSKVTDPLIQLKSLRPEPRHELYGIIVYASKCLVDESELLMREIKHEPSIGRIKNSDWRRSRVRQVHELW